MLAPHGDLKMPDRMRGRRSVLECLGILGIRVSGKEMVLFHGCGDAPIRR